MYSAVYCPTIAPGKQDPTRHGFATQDAAWSYAFTQMCEGCQKYIEEWKKDSETGDQHPACSYEWNIMLTSQFYEDEKDDRDHSVPMIARVEKEIAENNWFDELEPESDISPRDSIADICQTSEELDLGDDIDPPKAIVWEKYLKLDENEDNLFI